MRGSEGRGVMLWDKVRQIEVGCTLKIDLCNAFFKLQHSIEVTVLVLISCPVDGQCQVLIGSFQCFDPASFTFDASGA